MNYFYEKLFAKTLFIFRMHAQVQEQNIAVGGISFAEAKQTCGAKG